MMNKLKNFLFIRNGKFSDSQIKFLAFTSFSMLVLMVTGDGIQTPMGYIRNVKKEMQNEKEENMTMEEKLIKELGYTTYNEWKKAGILPSDENDNK
ncbi:conserved Plasmodium protein, unknown function [Plasmodium vinckei brucechwatti]|uniref:Uncharacterized protein n=1 Tax=Plasmodium vinckei brucechwatti TaxID=119398 RepID=A0A6V7RUC1_PLAVN|nr:conserved Plasmodium protein, unknown function [Plasmodium vinckei brucechwatti]